MTPRLEKRHADGVQSCTALACPKAARPRRSQISDVGGKGMPAIPRPHENEGVGEHVRTRFHFGPKASREIAELLPENRTERRKLVSSAGPRKRTVRPLT